MTTRADLRDLGESQNWGREVLFFCFYFLLINFFKCGCALFELGIYFIVYFSPSV